MKKLALALIFLFFVPFVTAEIDVLTQAEDFYNINERIPVKIVVAHTQEEDGFVKAGAICDNANLDYFVSPILLKTSPQELTIPDLKLTKTMAGKCSLEISLLDSSNALIEKEVVKVFEISSELILSTSLNKDTLSPGEELKIKGDLKNIRGELLDKGQVKIFLDENEFSTELNKGEFSYTYSIPSNIKSNSHSLKISYEDSFENKASKEFSIFIAPRPSKLKILINKLDFLPDDQITIESLLYDQADDLMENDAEIKVYGPDGKLSRQGTNKLDFNLEDHALPGSWVIKASTDEFKVESTFNVAEVKKVEVYVEDGIVYVRNIGNVPYDDEVEVKAIGEDGKEFTKRVQVDPSESRIIKLSDELKEGIYNLNLATNGEAKSFEEVSVPESDDPLYVTGKSVSNTINDLIDKPLLLFAILLAIILGGYFTIRNRRIKQFRKEKEIQQGYTRAREIEQQKIKQGITPRKFNINKDEAKDFTSQMLKRMDEKRQNNENPSSKSRRDEDNKPGLFGMFN